MDNDKERVTPAEPEEGLVLVEGGIAYDEDLLREARLRLEALERAQREQQRLRQRRRGNRER